MDQTAPNESASPDGTADTLVTDSSGGDSRTLEGGTADVVSAEAAGVDSAADAPIGDAGAPAGSCNTLTLAGLPLVNGATATSPTPPAQTGGSIADGTYVLTTFTVYGQASGGPTGVMFQGVWVISAGATHLEALFPTIVEVPDSGPYADASVPTGLPGSASGTDTLALQDGGVTPMTHTATCRGGVQYNALATWQYSVLGGGTTLTVIPDANGLVLATFVKQ